MHNGLGKNAILRSTFTIFALKKNSDVEMIILKRNKQVLK